MKTTLSMMTDLGMPLVFRPVLPEPASVLPADPAAATLEREGGAVLYDVEHERYLLCCVFGLLPLRSDQLARLQADGVVFTRHISWATPQPASFFTIGSVRATPVRGYEVPAWIFQAVWMDATFDAPPPAPRPEPVRLDSRLSPDPVVALRATRHALRLTQREAGALVHVGARTYGKWERGEQPFSSDARYLLEEAAARARGLAVAP